MSKKSSRNGHTGASHSRAHDSSQKPASSTPEAPREFAPDGTEFQASPEGLRPESQTSDVESRPDLRTLPPVQKAQALQDKAASALDTITKRMTSWAAGAPDNNDLQEAIKAADLAFFHLVTMRAMLDKLVESGFVPVTEQVVIKLAVGDHVYVKVKFRDKYTDFMEAATMTDLEVTRLPEGREHVGLVVKNTLGARMAVVKGHLGKL